MTPMRPMAGVGERVTDHVIKLRELLIAHPATVQRCTHGIPTTTAR